MNPINDYCIRGWDDMPKIGFCALTGERDNTMTRRLLVDMSLTGAEILTRLLSLDAEPFESNWNQHVGEAEAVSSAMIPADWWQEIAVFGLLVLGAKFVYSANGVVWTDEGSSWKSIDDAWAEAAAMVQVTLKPDDDGYSNAVRALVPSTIREIQRWRGLGGQPINNVHQMSGRQ